MGRTRDGQNGGNNTQLNSAFIQRSMILLLNIENVMSLAKKMLNITQNLFISAEEGLTYIQQKNAEYV